MTSTGKKVIVLSTRIDSKIPFINRGLFLKIVNHEESFVVLALTCLFLIFPSTELKVLLSPTWQFPELLHIRFIGLY